jgi:hypothetical protein
VTWPVALFLAFVSLFALAFLGAIAALIGERIADAIMRALRWVLA